jgi:hypothetical protein
MFVISQAMIDAGNRAEDLASTAQIIESFDGLGGGMTMAEAPSEITQWFGVDREVSDIIFEAMDALSESPFGNPATPAMIKAGNLVLENMITARVMSAMHNDSPEALCTQSEEIKSFLAKKDEVVSLVYARMRAVGAAKKCKCRTEF